MLYEHLDDNNMEFRWWSWCEQNLPLFMTSFIAGPATEPELLRANLQLHCCISSATAVLDSPLVDVLCRLVLRVQLGPWHISPGFHSNDATDEGGHAIPQVEVPSCHIAPTHGSSLIDAASFFDTTLHHRLGHCTYFLVLHVEPYGEHDYE